MGKYKMAIEGYSKTLSFDKNDYKSLVNRSNAHQAIGNIEEAIDDFKNAINLNHENIEVYSNLVSLLQIKGKMDEIFPLLEKYLQIAPETFEPYLAFASIDKQLSRATPKEKVEKARRLISQEDWYNRACLESVCDNFDLAFENLEKAAKREQFNPLWA